MEGGQNIENLLDQEGLAVLEHELCFEAAFVEEGPLVGAGSASVLRCPVAGYTFAHHTPIV